MARPRGFLLHPSSFRALLDAKGLAQSDIADRSGLSRQTISALCSHKTGASVATVRAIATAVGCDAEALFPEVSGRWTPVEISEVA